MNFLQGIIQPARLAVSRRRRNSSSIGLACDAVERRLLLTPDLVALDVDGPEIVNQGDRVRVGLSMENQGTQNARLWNYSIRLESADGTQSHLIYQTTVPDLRPTTFVGRNLLISVNIPHNIPDGRYDLVLTVDSTGRVRESNETNNSVVDEISVGRGSSSGGTGGGGGTTCFYSDHNDDLTNAANYGTVDDTVVTPEFGIEHICDVDMFAFTARARQEIGIDLDTDSQLSGNLRLFDEEGNELSSDGFGTAPSELFDLNRAAREAYIQYIFPETGTYYLGVSSAGNEEYDVLSGGDDREGNTTGDFTITFSHVRDVPAAARDGILGGILYEDDDEDDEWDEQSEDVLAGWRVYLDSNRNGEGDPGELFSTTDSRGRYEFNPLPAGSHQFVVSSTSHTQLSVPFVSADADYRFLATTGDLPQVELRAFDLSGNSAVVHDRSWSDAMDFDPVTETIKFTNSLLQEQDIASGDRWTDGRIRRSDGTDLRLDDVSIAPDGLIFGVEFSETSELFTLQPDGDHWVADRVAFLGREFDGTLGGAIEMTADGELLVSSGTIETLNGQLVVEANLYEVDPITGVTLRHVADLPDFADDLESTPDGRLLMLRTVAGESSTVREISLATGGIIAEQTFSFELLDLAVQIYRPESGPPGGAWPIVLRSGETFTEWNFGFRELQPDSTQDVDGDGDFDANDAFLMHLTQLSGSNTQIDQSKGASPLSAAEIRQRISDLTDSSDVDGDADVDANDTFLIQLVTLAGSDAQLQQSKGGSDLAAIDIRRNVGVLADAASSSGGSSQSASGQQTTRLSTLQLQLQEDSTPSFSEVDPPYAIDATFTDFRSWLSKI